MAAEERTEQRSVVVDVVLVARVENPRVDLAAEIGARNEERPGTWNPAVGGLNHACRRQNQRRMDLGAELARAWRYAFYAVPVVENPPAEHGHPVSVVHLTAITPRQQVLLPFQPEKP